MREGFSVSEGGSSALVREGLAESLCQSGLIASTTGVARTAGVTRGMRRRSRRQVGAVTRGLVQDDFLCALDVTSSAQRRSSWTRPRVTARRGSSARNKNGDCIRGEAAARTKPERFGSIHISFHDLTDSQKFNGRVWLSQRGFVAGPSRSALASSQGHERLE